MDVLQQADALDVDLDAVIRIIVRLTDVKDLDAFMEAINSDVAAVLPHESMACGVGITWSDEHFADKMLRQNFPPEYFNAFKASGSTGENPLLERWLEMGEPIAFESGRDDHEYPAEWVKIFKDCGLRNTAAHGVLGIQSEFASYFIFSNIAGSVGEKEIFLLKLLLPHLHFALANALAGARELQIRAEVLLEPITETEKEILQWINQGKTNWEISHILSKTENNVKYSIEKILAKLGVRNRTQAVSKAIQLGFLKVTKPPDMLSLVVSY